MALHDAVEVHQLSMNVVQHLGTAGRLQEEHGRGAREGLDVALMLREQGDQGLGETAFAADPGDEGCGVEIGGLGVVGHGGERAWGWTC